MNILNRYLIMLVCFIVSFALPNLMKNGLLDKSAAGKFTFSQSVFDRFVFFSHFSYRNNIKQPKYSICDKQIFRRSLV